MFLGCSLRACIVQCEMQVGLNIAMLGEAPCSVCRWLGVQCVSEDRNSLALELVGNRLLGSDD